jgi:hypothetical protein
VFAAQVKPWLIQRYQIMTLARALDREDPQELQRQLTGHVDPDPLLVRIQQMGDPSQMLNPEMK